MERFISEEITSEELSVLDNNSEWLGISKIQLMECAGFSLANKVKDKYNLSNNSLAIIFSGLGNNGGDGFVIARHLASQNIPIKVILLGIPERITTNEAIHNWKILSSLDYLIEIIIIKDSTDLNKIPTVIRNGYDNIVVIDALLGTGIKGKLREPISSCISLINNLKKEKSNKINVISVDVPSGMDPNSGKITDIAVKADLVITFHKPKSGLSFPSDHIKDLMVNPIGIPIEASLFVGKGDLIPTLKSRKIDAHKGQFGKVLVIGGSKNYSGAPAYASMTAINFGCDLVITYCPGVVADVIRSYSPNLIVRSSEGNWLNIDAYKEISWLIDWADTILIGPGLGLEKETEEVFIKILHKLSNLEKNLVIDADGLKLVKNYLDLIKKKQVILTPHEGELKIIKDIEIPKYTDIINRGNLVFNFAKEIESTLLLKGPYDYISNGKNLKINKTGCPEMSIGGTGDVLAGLCASFFTTGNDAFQSAKSAAFLNGYLGQYCLEKFGPRFNAMDMIEHLRDSIEDLR